MKISLYKEEGSTFAVLIQASPGKGRAPYLYPHVAREDLTNVIGAAIETLRGPRQPRTPSP